MKLAMFLPEGDEHLVEYSHVAGLLTGQAQNCRSKTPIDFIQLRVGRIYYLHFHLVKRFTSGDDRT